MTYLTNLLANRNLFMWLITFLFACSAIRQAWAGDFWDVVYSGGAAVIQLAVIMKG